MGDEASENTISGLINYVCGEEFSKPDLAGAFEVIDRVTRDKKE